MHAHSSTGPSPGIFITLKQQRSQRLKIRTSAIVEYSEYTRTQLHSHTHIQAPTVTHTHTHTPT